MIRCQSQCSGASALKLRRSVLREIPITFPVGVKVANADRFAVRASAPRIGYDVYISGLEAGVFAGVVGGFLAGAATPAGWRILAIHH